MDNNKELFFQFYKQHKVLSIALDMMGCDPLEWREWMKEESFAQEYNKINFEINAELERDSENKAIQIYNQIVSKGYTETKQIDRKITTNKYGKISVNKTVKVTRKELSGKDLKTVESFEKSLLNLLNSGAIPKSIALRILNICRETTNEMQNVFSPDEKTNVIDEKRALAVVRLAVLGSLDDIG